jgi:hypothetical protein
MKKFNCTVLLVLIAMLLAALPALAETVYGRVVGIADGDNVTILDVLSHFSYLSKVAKLSL